MTKKRIVITTSLVLAALILSGVAVFALNNINEKPPVVVEQTTEDTPTPVNTTPAAPITALTATFKGVDDIHWGRGTADVTTTNGTPTLTFKDDFEVAQGPDLYVYLSPNPAGQELGEYAPLGNLKSNSGVQEYNLPENYKDYKTVVIWCRAFAVTFATAELQ